MFQLAELEGCKKDLSKERDKLSRELDKARKESLKAQTKADRKAKKDAEKVKKKELLDTGVTSPEATGIQKVSEYTSI